MKKYISILLTIFLCLIVYGCEKTKVTFNYNCPGASIYKCDVVDKKINCTFTMPECGDKEFVGWYDKPVNGTRVNLDKDFTESTTLYAYWNDKETEKPVEEPAEIVKVEYKLSFNVNGGSGGQTDSFKLESGSELPEISKEKPTRDGYTFMGWYDNSDYTKGTQYYDENCNRILSFDKESDLILYAGWKESSTYEEPEPEPIDEEYMITFNSNGGYGGQSGYEYATYGKAMPTIDKTKPTRTGYEFMGWYDNSDYTKGTRYYDSNCSSVRTYDKKSGITLYAGWNIKTYTITYNLNGGSNGQTGTLSTTYNDVLPTISKSIPSRSRYTFKGWYDNSDYTKGTQYYNEKNEAVRVFNKTSNITLYAGWSKVVIVYKYTVKFNINNGTGTTPSDVTAILGNAMPTITTSVPTKSGYTFMGWYDNANYLNGTQYYTNQNKSARAYDRMSGITLYAGWKDNSYTVSFNPNGGSGGQVNSVNVKYGSKMPTISTVIPVRDGYTFMGWYDNKDYTKGTQYYTDKCASARTYNKASNTTLYAGWEEIKITMRYFIGDSRTVGMFRHIYANSSATVYDLAAGKVTVGMDTWSCKSAMGLDWMRSTGIPNIEDKLDKHSALIILMGVNGLDTEAYSNYVKEKLPTWKSKGAHVYYVSVNPCSGDHSYLNSRIIKFNEGIQKIEGITFIDTHTYLKEVGFYAPDGLHYSYDTDVKIYNYIINHL